MNKSDKITTNIRKFMLCACIGFLCGCNQSEIESSISGNDEMDGELVEMRISLADTPMYGDKATESRTGSGNFSTNERKVLVSVECETQAFHTQPLGRRQ